MDYARGVVFGAVGVILVTTLVSGPLVPGVALTSEPAQQALGQGTATVADATLPETATFERASFGAENYHLTVPATTVRFSTLEGSPTLSYRLTIAGLDYTRTTTHFLGPSTGDRYRLTMRSDTFSLEAINQSSYEGRLSVVKRDSSGETVVASRTVTIGVSG
ncbi:MULTISPECIES: hypothetical protein [Haloarcula]|uniref:hypothetical protein n=1 Tax=Haloarcula TaxID=2237 RepID=UPI0023EC6F19|nr:hypothetical protein [Halomicroarcula sp. XH51]